MYLSHIQIYLSTLHTCVCIHTCIATQTCIQSYIHTYIYNIHIYTYQKKNISEKRGGKKEKKLEEGKKTWKREKKNWKREKKTGRGRKKLEEKKLSSTASLAAMSAPSARSLAAVLVSPSALARIRSVWPCSLLDSYRASMSMLAASMASSRTSTVASCFSLIWALTLYTSNCSTTSCTLV